MSHDCKPYREDEGVSTKPLTMKVTLLNPVLVFPQDEADPDSNALFVQVLPLPNQLPPLSRGAALSYN